MIHIRIRKHERGFLFASRDFDRFLPLGVDFLPRRLVGDELVEVHDLASGECELDSLDGFLESEGRLDELWLVEFLEDQGFDLGRA